MNELKEWIIAIVIAGVIWYAFDGCENKSKEEKNEEPVYLQWEPTPASQSSYTPSQSTNTSPSNNSYNDDWEPVIVESDPEPEPKYNYSYSYSSSFNSSNSYEEDKYDDYEETSRCLDGEIVYEGDDDYYIVETRSGYTILERRSGGSLYEGDRIRGELHNYGTTYIIKKNTDREVRVYIEEYMLSDDRAIEWMGDHDHLDSSDQDVYDAQND